MAGDNEVTFLPESLLLLPDAIAPPGSRRLHAIWAGPLGSGLMQALNGGYCAFRLLVRPVQVVSAATGSTTFRRRGSTVVRVGEHLVLRASRPQPNWFDGHCRVTIAAMVDDAAGAVSLAEARRGPSLVVAVVAIGYADGGGEAPGLSWDGREVSFSPPAQCHDG